jgi:hypothetical protein
MNKPRSAILIQWGILALGIASLILFFREISDHSPKEPISSSTFVNEDKLLNKTRMGSRLSFPMPARPSNTLSRNQSKKKPPTPPLTSKTLRKVIKETPKANGNFFSAQEITEGIIIGKRGSEKDLADYYRVRATKDSLTLKLETFLEDGNHGFFMTIFDEEKRVIGKESREKGSATSFLVTPYATYYIKIDLKNAPTDSPQYRLYVDFQERETGGSGLKMKSNSTS